MTMWKMKSCPRCKGDVFLSRDMDGWYEQCVQCCFRQDLRPVAELHPEPILPERRVRRSKAAVGAAIKDEDDS
jgi:hypothetical protein